MMFPDYLCNKQAWSTCVGQELCRVKQGIVLGDNLKRVDTATKKAAQVEGNMSSHI